MDNEELKLETVELNELKEADEAFELTKVVKVSIWVWRSEIWADKPAVATPPKIPTIN